MCVSFQRLQRLIVTSNLTLLPLKSNCTRFLGAYDEHIPYLAASDTGLAGPVQEVHFGKNETICVVNPYGFRGKLLFL